MQTKEKTNLTSWDDHLDRKYDKAGTPAREEWEQEFDVFKLGVLLSEARVKLSTPKFAFFILRSSGQPIAIPQRQQSKG
jgi:hypothetical protein